MNPTFGFYNLYVMNKKTNKIDNLMYYYIIDICQNVVYNKNIKENKYYIDIALKKKSKEMKK